MIRENQRRQKWEEDRQRRAAAAKWIDFYNWLHKGYLKKDVEKAFPKTAEAMIRFAETVDLTREIIDEIAVMFDNGLAVRVVDAADGSLLPDMLADMLRDAMFVPTMDSVEAHEKLTHKVLVRPVWRDGHVELDMLLPDRVFVEQEPDNPKKARAVYYSVRETTDTPMHADRKHVYMKMTAEEISMVELGLNGGDEKILSSEPNPYGVIPVAEFQSTLSINSYWPEKGQPLVDANALLNLLATQYWFGFRFQTFGQPIIRGEVDGDNDQQQMVLSPDSPLTFLHYGDGSQPGTLEFVTPDSPFEKAWEILRDKFPASIAQSFGLTKDVFRASGSSFASGYHLRLAREPIVKKSMADRAYYRPAIQKLLGLMMKTYDLNTADKQFGDAELMIDFPEPRVDLDPLQQEPVRAMRTANGTWSPKRSVMADNPDLTEDDADAEVAALRAENTALQTVSLAGALADEVEE